MYDDFEFIGDFDTLKDAWRTGKIKNNLMYFYKMYREDGFYSKDNISVYDWNNINSRCLFLAHIISRRARLTPDPYNCNIILTKTVKELANFEL